MSKAWCTRREAARQLGVTAARVSQLAREGRLIVDYDAEGRARVSVASLQDEILAREMRSARAPIDDARRAEIARESAELRARALRDRRRRDERLDELIARVEALVSREE